MKTSAPGRFLVLVVVYQDRVSITLNWRPLNERLDVLVLRGIMFALSLPTTAEPFLENRVARAANAQLDLVPSKFDVVFVSVAREDLHARVVADACSSTRKLALTEGLALATFDGLPRRSSCNQQQIGGKFLANCGFKFVKSCFRSEVAEKWVVVEACCGGDGSDRILDAVVVAQIARPTEAVAAQLDWSGQREV
jgi:hypothetical protein